MVYIPYGILCIGIAIVIINGLKKSRDNKKTNRVIRNSERFQNTIAILKAKKEKKDGNSDFTE